MDGFPVFYEFADFIIIILQVDPIAKKLAWNLEQSVEF
jgi:hypothetical protein